MSTKQRFLMGTLSMLVVAVSLGILVNCHAKSNYMYENFEIFSSVFQAVRAQYYDISKIDSKQLIYGAIKGMLDSLDDEHSTFLDQKQIRSLREETTGNFGGLGIMIGIRDEKLTVISPIEGTPAWDKHLRPGDVITHINGESTKGVSLTDAVSKLRGPVGTKVTIRIVREGNEEPFEVSIIRAVIQIKTVRYEYIKQGQIGYIRLTQFSQNTAQLLGQAVADMRKQGRLKAVIVDLRNNPGGLLSAAHETSNLFLSEGLIVYTKGRVLEQTQRFNADRFSTILPDSVPLVVLVNKGSASASEIFAGAMQDTRRGLLIGEKTYGKGSVQTLQPLADGSALKLTIALYYTPSGKQIHKQGLTPDVEIKIPEYTTEEIKAVTKLRDGKLLHQFLQKHPAYTPKELEDFRNMLLKEGIKLPLLEVERWLYWEKNQIGTPALFNLKFDQQLRDAVEMIRAGKIRTRPLRIFKEIKE